MSWKFSVCQKNFMQTFLQLLGLLIWCLKICSIFVNGFEAFRVHSQPWIQMYYLEIYWLKKPFNSYLLILSFPPNFSLLFGVCAWNIFKIALSYFEIEKSWTEAKTSKVSNNSNNINPLTNRSDVEEIIRESFVSSRSSFSC